MSNYYKSGLLVNRQTGELNVSVDYFIEGYTDPETQEQRDSTYWRLGYQGLNFQNSSTSGAGSDFGYTQITISANEDKTLTYGTLNFYAENTFTRANLSNTYTVMNGSLVASDQSITGSSGDDILVGGVGNDTIGSSAGSDLIDAGAGDDVVSAGAGDDTLDGGEGADVLVGGTGNDTYVVDGPDIFVGIADGDAVVSFLSNYEAIDDVVERAGGGVDTVITRGSYILDGNIENLKTSSGPQAIIAIGNELDNDIQVSGYGSDYIDGGTGADTMTGGRGSDIYIVDNINDKVIESVDGEFTYYDQVRASVSYALASEVENLVLTGTNNINGTGNSKDNALTGNSGTNALSGLDGADTLDGKAGADTMTGGVGSDTYYVDNVGDRCVEANGAAGTDLVYASVSYSLAGSELENLTLTGTDNINGTGNSIANVITGNAGNNVLNGMAGADTMIGGAGSDIYYVDRSTDKAIEANGAAGTDLVYASASFSLAASELENLTLTGTGNLSGTGNGIANVIVGNTGANVLNGMAGKDILTGLAGKDTFVFSTALGATNVDRITDFSAADDTIQLSKAVFTALSAGTLAATAFKDLSVSGATVDADDRILYNKTTGVLSYDADGSGSKAAVQFVTIDTKVALTAADFFVV